MKTIEAARNLTPTIKRPTRKMVYWRTIEIALLDGRSPLQIKQSDYEQAKRELTGVSDLDLQLEILDQAG